MRVIIKFLLSIGIALLLLSTVLMYVLIRFDEHVTLLISIGLFLLILLLFVYLLRDCIRRSEADFPTVIYGGKALRQKSVKKTWTWLLILSFILGLVVSQEVGHSTATASYPEVETSVTSKSEYTHSFLFVTYEVHKIDDKKIYEKKALRLPLFFLIGVSLYYLGVKRWHREH